MNQAVLQPESTNFVCAEYEAIRGGIGVLEIPAGKLRLSGKNAVQFLNGLVSNDVKTLAPGEGVLAAFPTLQGKLAALCRIYNIGDGLLLELDATNREKIFKNLSRFVPAGEFFVTDAGEELALISLQGPRAAELLAALTGQTVDAAQFKISERQIGGVKVLVASHRRCGEIGFDLFVESGEAAKVKQAILAGSEAFGAREVGEAAFEIARIEAGVPREGVDAGEDYIILESELDAAVSYTKGCYLGQEVIARIHWRGQPAKRLRGLLIDGNALPERGAELIAVDGQAAGRRVGEITSSAHSLALNRKIALGYVHRYYLNPGTEFVVKQGETEIGRATLTEFPFVKTRNE
ncbi:MAG TPA: glycine cleavage T C-terminal barrel domain-containing protein [Blastocatellia bacterium]|nr:glycine cleavage T C-terminal barrel domain-containing protein [Blastocatellia bacterium]HMY72822.1 glycine cleavage T C-terminal barrel domain-containing protein [Blastocatellia bacterium]HMZ19855.1 glycine cleavage T C-terminal barrel domain-containing protein [Blastocatellia bacterium]HNG29589.1 glycine cleavage T C-terminal barrel domain-containing protein [Blastocatellia bacterium]